MATNKTQQETPANAERRGYWAGFKAGVAKGTNWVWAHRPSPIKLLYYVFGAIVIFLALYLLLGGRLTDLHGPTDFTQADIDAAVARAIAAQNNSTSNCPTGQIETQSFGCIPEADAQIVLGLEGRSTEELASLLNPNNENSTTSANPGNPMDTADTDERVARLLSLDAVYRSSGWQNWLNTAGVTWGSNVVEARQPEEETLLVNGEYRVLVSGVQIRGNGVIVNYPNCLTTDRPSEVSLGVNSRTFQPDLRNPSTLYTNVVLNGQATVWTDCSNWSQMRGAEAPAQATSAPTSTNVPSVNSTQQTSSGSCLSLTQLLQNGNLEQELEYPAGTLAGVQMTFTKAWTAPSGWTVQVNGQEVRQVVAGQKASVWSPESCRPLGR